jgi:hypothetical protein
MQGKFHAIINVVCYGYNETENQGVTIFDSGSNTVKAQYLKDNLKLELEQLNQWVNDITAHSKINLKSATIRNLQTKKDLSNKKLHRSLPCQINHLS